MTKFKKSLTALMAVVSTASALCVPMGASATANSTNNVLNIRTTSVPNNVVSYARDAFSSYSYDDMVNLDFDPTTVQNVRLGKPFVVETFDMPSDGYMQYYFPVVDNTGIQAVLTVNVNNTDNSMGYQLGKDALTSALMNAYSSQDSTITVCANNDCYFSVDSDGNTALLYDFDAIDGNENLSTQIDDAWYEDSNIVQIDSNNVYGDTLRGWNMARSTVGIKLPVVYVSNVGDNCWAACFGCLSTFYTNPTTGGSVNDGENMRNIAMLTYSSGGITEVKALLSHYNNITMTASDPLSWNDIKSQISSRSPFYTRWTRTGGAHAMVLSGYTYDNTTGGSKKIYVMDPNAGTNISINYNSSGCTYSPSTNRTYTWVRALHK